jgi:hypothetical protein
MCETEGRQPKGFAGKFFNYTFSIISLLGCALAGRDAGEVLGFCRAKT